MHHERSKRRDGLDQSVEPKLAQPSRQRQNPRAETPIDPLAELDYESRVSRGQQPIFAVATLDRRVRPVAAGKRMRRRLAGTRPVM
jgi:hypothetical protein